MQSPTNTISVFFYCTILVVCLSHQSDARDTITTSNPLRDDANETLVSAGGRFELGFFTAGGNNRYVGIWYHNMSRRVVWVANRDAPVTDSSGSFAIAEDGNLKVLSNVNAIPITHLKNVGVNRTVKLLNNGNLIFFDGPSPLWRSFKNPTDTFIGTGDVDNLVDGFSSSPLNVRLAESDMGLKARDCKPCGDIMIPYPLSTGPNCGDPLYSSFDCDESVGIFHFQTLSGNYSVFNINKENRTFFIEVNSETANSCDARNLLKQIVKLNQSSPFTVTNGCYKRRIEISWKPPLEPSCNVSGDCRDWPNSSCHARANDTSRCYCDQEYQWDGTSLNCIQGRSHARRPKDVILIIVAVFAAVLLVCCFSYNLYRRKMMTRRNGSDENSVENPVLWLHESSDRQVSDLMDEENKSGVDVPFCSWESILAATENFSDVHKLGRGGFGPVYKGMFPGGREIAVKRLSSYSAQGINEFRNEVVLIAKLQHRNLVRLLGYCIKENEKILLYEYMPNKSLDAFIFDKKLCMLLNWKKRFDIVLGIARGVLYLHQDSRLRIIHRDLKTSNILLDEEMNPKISDFGLARIVKGKGTEASTNKVMGTYGYMSPEYALDGLFSTKSDVFSFGVVVLEIINGKRNTDFYESTEALNLLGYAWRLWSENKALDLMDPILLESCEKSEVMKCINVGLLCVQEDPGDRPTMSNVVLMLVGEATVLPVPNQPAFVMRRQVCSTSSSSTKPGSISNELTMSEVEGR